MNECPHWKPAAITSSQERTVVLHRPSLIQIIIIRRAARLGYRSVDSPTFDDVISIADDRLLERITMDHNHLLRQLLPAERSQQHNLRRRSYNYDPSKNLSVVQILLPVYYMKINVKN